MSFTTTNKGRTFPSMSYYEVGGQVLFTFFIKCLRNIRFYWLVVISLEIWGYFLSCPRLMIAFTFTLPLQDIPVTFREDTSNNPRLLWVTVKTCCQFHSLRVISGSPAWAELRWQGDRESWQIWNSGMWCIVWCEHLATAQPNKALGKAWPN